MAAIDELKNDPLSFIRHYYLGLSAAMCNPPSQYVERDGTVRLKLVDTTDNYIRFKGTTRASGIAEQPTRRRNRKGVGALLAKFGGESQSFKPTRHYTLELAKLSDEGLYAYVCPYLPDQTHNKMLGGDANLMFTAEMSGCTFGIGSALGDGTRMVCHSNEASVGSTQGGVAQAAAQRSSATSALTPPGAKIGQQVGVAFEPMHYRDASTEEYEVRATVVGFRRKNDWQFWAQVYKFGNAQSDLQVLRVG